MTEVQFEEYTTQENGKLFSGFSLMGLLVRYKIAKNEHEARVILLVIAVAILLSAVLLLWFSVPQVEGLPPEPFIEP